MYDLINANIGIVLQFIASDPTTVPEYDWLVDNLQQVATKPYQDRYGVYWVMRFPGAAWRKVYFQELQTALLNPANPPSLTVLATNLYKTPTNAKGQSNQFSFITKLVHMVDSHSPIYDDRVAAFYFFQKPDSGPGQTQDYVNFQAFLVQEYRRVLQNGLLSSSIQSFRQQFTPQHFTDERVVDVLIWGYVGLLMAGALTSGQITYR
jgi:hypothetical protein